MNRIADDYDGIAARLRALKGDATAQEQEVCPKCEGGGWIEMYSPHPPAFQECDDCYNPEGLPSP